jgi:hypothetical protein
MFLQAFTEAEGTLTAIYCADTDLILFTGWNSIIL